MLKALSYASRRSFATSKPNPYNELKKTLTIGGKEYKYFSLPDLKDDRLGKIN